MQTGGIEFMKKEFATPEIKEVRFVEDNQADEYITIPVSRYETLLDVETRLDMIVDIIESDLYIDDLKKAVLIMLAHGSDIEEFAGKDGNSND